MYICLSKSGQESILIDAYGYLDGDGVIPRDMVLCGAVDIRETMGFCMGRVRLFFILGRWIYLCFAFSSLPSFVGDEAMIPKLQAVVH